MAVWSDYEKRHGELQTKRQQEEGTWRDLSRLLEEDGQDFNARNDTRTTPEVYDSTPLYAKDEFVGGLFTASLNPADRWFELGIEDKDLQKWGPVADWLWKRCTRLLNSFSLNRSSFYVGATSWLGDMATFGGGFMWQEELVGERSILDRPTPIREIFIDVDGNGRTDTVHREFMQTGRQAKTKFGDVVSHWRDDESVLIVHAVHRNTDYRPDRPGSMPWTSCYVSPDKRDFSRRSGYWELPCHGIEWKRRSGRTWPTGPGHKALADMRGLDEMSRSGLIAAQFAAEPMMLVADEDVMTAADIMPNALIPGGMTESGKRKVDILNRGEDLRYQMTERAATRSAIQSAFHFSLMQLINRPQMTGTEWLGWNEEKLRSLAPHLVTVQPGLASYIRRRDGILQRAGQYDDMPPPRELQGQAVEVGFVSPFAQAQRLSQARSAMQIGTSALSLKEAFPEITDNVNGDELMRTIASGFNSNPALLNDPRLVEKRRQARAAAIAQEAEVGQAAQMAGVVADVSHAAQAFTSARGRGNGAGK